MLREEGVTFQRLKPGKLQGPGLCGGKARVEHLDAIADREVIPEAPRAGGDLLRG